MENISYHVAAGKIDKDLLKEIICAVIEDDMEIGIKIHFGVFLNEEGSQEMKTVLHLLMQTLDLTDKNIETKVTVI